MLINNQKNTIMKNFLQLLILLTTCSISNAQLVTITATNQMPQAGDTVKYIDANTFGFAVDGTGPVTDKLWDFGALMDAGTTIDFWYVDAASTPQAANYPNANLARQNTSAAGYDYYEITGTQINRWGMYADATSWIINYDPATEFQFPITAGGSYSSSYAGEMSPYGVGEDSVRIEQGQITASADMQGTLILPNGTYTNVLRIHVIESFHIVAYMFGTPALDNLVEDDYYYWFSDSIPKPILIYGTTSLDGTQQSEVLRYQKICNYLFSENNQICQGDTLIWHGQVCDTAGTYYDNYTTVDGCDSIYEMNLTVDPLPAVYLGQDTTICDFDNIVLDAGQGYMNYSWSTGASSQTETIDSSGTGYGTISVSVYVVDSAGCGASDQINITFDNCSYISGINKNKVLIYPNPTDKNIFIDCNNLEYTEIYNIVGEKLYTTKEKQIDLSRFNESVFIIRVQTKDTKLVRKIILAK